MRPNLIHQLVAISLALVSCAPTAQPTPAVTSAAPATPTSAAATPTRVPATSTPMALPSPTASPFVGVSAVPAGKYLFVEMTYRASGTGKLPGLMIDFPAYRFDAATGVLRPFSPSDSRLFAMAASDWGLAGRTSWRDGAAGGGGAGTVVKIPTMPAELSVPIGSGVSAQGNDTTRQGTVRLTAVAADGTLQAEIDGELVRLAVNQQWSRASNYDVATLTFSGRYTLTSSVANRGWLERASIQTQP